MESKHVKRVPDAEILPKKLIYPYDVAAMLALGEHCSLTERRADDASREAMDWLKCEYMQNHIGDTFEGVINT